MMLTGSAEGRTGESRENSRGLTTVVVVVPVELAAADPLLTPLAAAAAGVTTMVCVMGFGFFRRL